ncbi:hypothetical protein [Methylobacterium sp. WL120]|uniref:hypothetical protein n=1 Tax=Methylobacterium sp. WL120 TaxID=2603887 RepID=UPI0011C84A8A|nr:hypothetical protein [Methylobacterium sp. WL120]TXM69656.1 hypothetical protein FV229_04745 [Methylobacterium sp. WL120]
MRPIDLQVRNLRRWSHPFFMRGGQSIDVEPLRQLLNARTWRRHPRPFAKTVKGKQRRDERRFIDRQTCGFGCD